MKFPWNIFMEWLIIHPKDETTQFLTDCYNHINDSIVINNPSAPKNVIRQLIRQANNVMLLGHGSQYGLFSTTSKTNSNRFDRIIVDCRMVDELRKKSKIIGLFCNARDFFQKYNLKGFALGMFVSELSEADYMSLPLCDEMIEESNKMLTKTIASNYTKKPDAIYQNFISDFDKLSDNPIADYNSSEIRYFI